MAKYDLTIREEELKNLVRDDWFSKYDGNKIIGNIDLSVCVPTEPGQLELFDLDFFLWAEAKKGNKEDIDDSLVQLIITIMKARTYNDYLPPLYLGAFDAEKIAFIPYDEKLQRQVIFDPILENNIDWTTITPSDHSSKAFEDVRKKAKEILLSKMQFDFVHEEKLLKQFIRSNFIAAKTGTNKINITLNRMTSIFNRWLETVKPTIKAPWTNLAELSILPADFFLADVISKNNQSLGESLQVLLRSNAYRVKIKNNVGGLLLDGFLSDFKFTDNQKAHKTFWNKYNRPPRRKDRLLMQERRDLLVEPDRRERKGAYFTPSMWVDLSRDYLTKELGPNWQEEYYVWDCCAGTGNLLYGLTEKERIFASTLDDADVTYMKSQKNLLPLHVFQFDFLNDDLQGDKVPEDLKRILKDPEQRKKLVVYINPPYAESGAHFVENGGKKYVGINAVHDKYAEELADANREIFAQFLMRIIKEIPSCIIAEFSKCKTLSGSHFKTFRQHFSAKLMSMFIMPAWTFDNVKGKFPIGFKIWDTSVNEIFKETSADVYNEKGEFEGTHNFSSYINNRYFSSWVASFRKKEKKYLGWLSCVTLNDFQSQRIIAILNDKHQISLVRGAEIYDTNIIESVVCIAVRHCIEANWLNDRDQFLYPRKAWKDDKEFQNDCLAFTLFHGQNRISSAQGTNHWIPFTEKEVSAPMLFESHFMSDFIAGKMKPEVQETLFGSEESLIPTEPIQFSHEAQTVMDAGRELWRYYLMQENINVNASFYDIRRYFQGENKKGKMNPDSKDEKYMSLWGNVKEALKNLAAKIAPKVYLYGFLLDETTLPEDEKDIVKPQEPLPVKPAKRTPKPKAKSSSVTIVKHYHIDTYNDNSTNYNIEK